MSSPSVYSPSKHCNPAHRAASKEHSVNQLNGLDRVVPTLFHQQGVSARWILDRRHRHAVTSLLRQVGDLSHVLDLSLADRVMRRSKFSPMSFLSCPASWTIINTSPYLTSSLEYWRFYHTTSYILLYNLSPLRSHLRSCAPFKTSTMSERYRALPLPLHPISSPDGTEWSF
jgi:hypothetical protein